MNVYKEILQDVMEFFGGKRLLSVADVRRYTGLADYRTIKRRFPFYENTITPTAFAAVLAKGECERS